MAAVDRHPTYLSHLPYLAVFAVLAVLCTWPLATHISSGVIGGTGDNLSFVWDFWWARTARFTHQPVFWTPDLFAPIGTSLATHTLVPIFTVSAAWLLPYAGPIALYNGALLLSTLLNFLCAYGAAYTLTRDRLASAFAAVTFGAAPVLIVRLAGHLNVLSAWGLPLTLMATLHYLRRPAVTRALALSVVLAVLAYTDYYDLIFGVGIVAFTLTLSHWRVIVRRRPLTPTRARLLTTLATIGLVAALTIAWIAVTGGADTSVAGLRLRMTDTFNLRVALGFLTLATGVVWAWPRVECVERADRAHASAWRLLPIAGAALLVLLGPLLLAAVRLWQSGDYSSQAYVWRNAPPGIDLATLVLGNQLHPLTGTWTTDVYRHFGVNAIEGAAWLGLAPLLMLVVAIRGFRARADVQTCLSIGGFFFVWSLGPYLRVLGYNTGLMLPETILRVIPIAANARIPGRAFVVVQLMVALVGSIALAGIRERNRRRGAMLAALAIAVVLLDYWPAPRLVTAINVLRLYTTLRTLPPGIVLEVPLGVRDGFGSRGDLDHRVLFYQMVHEHPQMGGFVARLSKRTASAYESDPIVGSILDLSEHLPATRTVEAGPCRASLACSVRYVIVDSAAASSDLDTFVKQSFSLRLLEQDGARSLSIVDSVTGCGCEKTPAR